MTIRRRHRGSRGRSAALEVKNALQGDDTYLSQAPAKYRQTDKEQRGQHDEDEASVVRPLLTDVHELVQRQENQKCHEEQNRASFHRQTV